MAETTLRDAGFVSAPPAMLRCVSGPDAGREVSLKSLQHRWTIDGIVLTRVEGSFAISTECADTEAWVFASSALGGIGRVAIDTKTVLRCCGHILRTNDAILASGERPGSNPAVDASQVHSSASESAGVPLLPTARATHLQNLVKRRLRRGFGLSPAPPALGGSDDPRHRSGTEMLATSSTCEDIERGGIGHACTALPAKASSELAATCISAIADVDMDADADSAALTPTGGRAKQLRFCQEATFMYEEAAPVDDHGAERPSSPAEGCEREHEQHRRTLVQMHERVALKSPPVRPEPTPHTTRPCPGSAPPRPRLLRSHMLARARAAAHACS